MYFNLSEENSNKINEMIEEQVMGKIEALLKNEKAIDELVRECFKGAIKGVINSILQSVEYRSILRDRIMAQLNLKEEE